MDATKKLPVFDESVAVDWEPCPLVEPVRGRVSGVGYLPSSTPGSRRTTSSATPIRVKVQRRSLTCSAFRSILFGEYSSMLRRIDGPNSTPLDQSVRRSIANQVSKQTSLRIWARPHLSI
jgi:hypothetical protein